MGKLLSSNRNVVLVTLLWAMILAVWPEATSAAPHPAATSTAPHPAATSAAPRPAQSQPPAIGGNSKTAAKGSPSEDLIIGLAAGLASLILILLVVAICLRPRCCFKRANLSPVKPLIHSTTTTVVTTQDRSRSRGPGGAGGGSDSSSGRWTFSPVPMTRIPIHDPFEEEDGGGGGGGGARDAAGPLSRQPPGAARYSVHVGAQSRRSISSRRGALPPLQEGPGAPVITPPSRATNSSQSDYFGPVVTDGPRSPGPDQPRADRRGRPGLQNHPVASPAPSSTSSTVGEKGKGKARVYYQK